MGQQSPHDVPCYRSILAPHLKTNGFKSHPNWVGPKYRRSKAEFNLRIKDIQDDQGLPWGGRRYKDQRVSPALHLVTAPPGLSTHLG